MQRRRQLLAMSVAALLAYAREGHAANDGRLRDGDRVAVAAALDTTAAPRTSGLSAQQLAPALGAAFRLAPSWVITADGALAVTSSRIGDAPRGTVTRASNVLLGARWTPRLRSNCESLELVFGVSSGAPLVTVPSGGITASAAAEQADRVALGAAGPAGTWRWARNAIPLVTLARASYTFGLMRATFELEPGLLVSVNRDASRAALVTRGEVALGGFAVSPYVAGAAVVSTRPLDGRDFAQTSAEIGARHELGAFFAWSEARLQLDGPQGFIERYATFWGATVGLGARM